MPREIKFRAWNKSNSDPKERMIYQALLDANGKVLMPDGDSWGIPVMQYTGLKDKSGKEIYEGDIVLGQRTKYEVVWNDECARWGLLDGENYPVAIHHGGKKLMVLGNVYENPELLK